MFKKNEGMSTSLSQVSLESRIGLNRVIQDVTWNRMGLVTDRMYIKYPQMTSNSYVLIGIYRFVEIGMR